MTPTSRLGSALVLLTQVALAPLAAADEAHAGRAPRRAGRIGPDPSFAQVWVVERSAPGLYEVLARLTSSDAFSPVVLAGSGGETTRAAELNHLLEILPPGASTWVGDGPVPVGLNVDRVLRPWAVPAEEGAGVRVVYCPDPELEPLAALAAMRLDGPEIAASATGAVPAFWIVDACATARYLDPEGQGGSANQGGNANLLSAIQSRLAFGALLAVEVVGQASGSIWWPTLAAERGIAVGELVRRGMSAAVAAYRGDDGAAVFPDGSFPRPGDDASNLGNARTAMLWVGDPLTVLE